MHKEEENNLKFFALLPSGFTIRLSEDEEHTISSYYDLREAYELGYNILHDGKEVEDVDELLHILEEHYSSGSEPYDKWDSTVPLYKSVEVGEMESVEFIRADEKEESEPEHEYINQKRNSLTDALKIDKDGLHSGSSMINQPKHYIGDQGLEVETVLQNFVPRYQDAYVGHRVSSSLEYLLRAPLKNKREDIEKAKKNLEQALEYIDKQEEDPFS